jgi:DNA-binding transcriptional LysR family regulator
MSDELNTSKRSVRPDLARFEWGDIAVFLTLARHKSLSGAALLLNVNHSTVGRRIRELESALETKLFERTRHGFLLTDAGELLFKDAEGIEAHISNIALQFSGEESRISGTVRVATMEALGSLFLAPKFVDLYQKVPSINIELVTASHWVNLPKREADVLISFPKPNGHRIDSEKIGEFALFLYASQNYLEQYGTPVTIDDLKNHRFVGYIDELIMIPAVRWLSDVLRNQDAQFRSTSLVAQYHATAAGMGVSMLPTFVAESDPRLVRLLPNQIKVKRDLWLSVHHDLEHINRVKQVLKFLKNLVHENADYLEGK